MGYIVRRCDILVGRKRDDLLFLISVRVWRICVERGFKEF